MASLTENTSRIANAKENIKTSIQNHGIDILDTDKIESYAEKVDLIANLKNEDQFCYLFKNGRFLDQFNNIIAQSDGVILDCTGMFHNICLKDTTYRDYDFQNLNLSKCTNFYDCFTGGADWWTVRGKILNFDMSSVENCNYTFNTCTYLTALTFKEGATFGGNSSSASLTLDLSQTALDKTSFKGLIDSISINNSRKTRIFKVKSALYTELTDEILDIADEKNYTIASA